MRPVSVSVLFLLFALASLPSPGAAQIPGGDPSDSRARWEAARARMRAEALSGVRETLERWSQAWFDDDAEGLADLYTEGASVRGLPFGTGLHRDGIRERFDEALPEVGDIRLDLNEFDASGQLAYGVGRYRYRPLHSGAGDELRSGTVLMVFLKEGGDWKVRSQLFRPEEGDGDG